MAHFDPKLREELRDDLMKTVGVALRDELPKAMQAALLQAMDNQIFHAIDNALERFLESDDMDCWMTFGPDGPHVLVGVGPGDCAACFEPEMLYEFAPGRKHQPRSGAGDTRPDHRHPKLHRAARPSRTPARGAGESIYARSSAPSGSSATTSSGTLRALAAPARTRVCGTPLGLVDDRPHHEQLALQHGDAILRCQ